MTQQTEVLATLVRQLRTQPAHAAADEPPEDPAFQWDRLVLPSETNFPVPSTGKIQRMATSLFAKIPTLTGRGQHEARFVLQVISMWPDLGEEDRRWAYQRLNLYYIVDCGVPRIA